MGRKAVGHSLGPQKVRNLPMDGLHTCESGGDGEALTYHRKDREGWVSARRNSGYQIER